MDAMVEAADECSVAASSAQHGQQRPTDTLFGANGSAPLFGSSRLKLVHVVPHVNQEASGPSYSVPRLCESLAELGHDVEMSCLAAGRSLRGVEVDVHPEWPILRRFAISSSHALALRQKATKVDVVHNHSLWSMVNVAAGWAVPGGSAKLVTSPRGTLSAWALANSRTLKKLLWPIQKRALERADLLHATAESEYDEIRALGLRAPVALVPNGIDIPASSGDQRDGLPKRGRTLLYLSRIHPKKGLKQLLEAWVSLEPSHQDWRLVIAGTGEAAHELEVRRLVRDLALSRVELPGALYGDAKSDAYFGASLFVLPTHSENFGMVVAEALAHGCPAIVTRGAPWSRLHTERCGWWVDNEVDALATALRTAMSLPEHALLEMGARGRDWMIREYSWQCVAQRMDSAYRWLLQGGQVPDIIRAG